MTDWGLKALYADKKAIEPWFNLHKHNQHDKNRTKKRNKPLQHNLNTKLKFISFIFILRLAQLAVSLHRKTEILIYSWTIITRKI